MAALILSADLVLGLIHIVVMVGWDAPNVLRIDMDGSYGEAYQYAKYLWLVILLLVYARQNRNWPIVAWALLFAYFMFDDALVLHERVGFWYSSEAWSFGVGPISAQTVGELAASGVVGLLLLVPLIVGYVRADTRTKWIFRVMLALMVVLLVFALVVDAVHGQFNDIRIIDRGLGFIEDFGEMLALTALAVFAFRINVSGGMQGFPEAEVTDVRSDRHQDAPQPAP